jgi:RNA polymerase sigma-70 factor (ECF subfamily)
MDTERSLLHAARMMDKEALAEIFDLYAPPLYNYAFRLCGDSLLADQIVGDVFARLFDQLSAGGGPKYDLRAYLYRTTYHRIVDEARYSNRRAPLDALISLKQDAQAERLTAEDQIMFELVLEMVQNDLTDDQRHVIMLRFLEEFSLRETAEILGKDINYVKVIQVRAIARLRRAFEYRDMKTAVSLPGIRKLSKAAGSG